MVSIDYLFVFEKYFYLQVYLDNCADKILDKKMRVYLDDYLFD